MEQVFDGVRSRARWVFIVALAFWGALGFLSPALAQSFAAKRAVVVENDVGGQLRPRLVKVIGLRASGQEVRIVGNVCYSTCTLYLGLANTCVSPRTVFGFHGPSSNGRPLAPEHFEQASRVIVANYPPILREWYMTVARYELRGLLKVDGAQLARIGAARLCEDL